MSINGTAPGATSPARLNPVWDSTGGIGLQKCGGCGAVHTDGDAQASTMLLSRLWASALAAGWHDTPRHGMRCPDCHAKAEAEQAAGVWDDGPGTRAYQERLDAHVQTMTEVDAGLNAIGHAARLAFDDLAVKYAQAEGAMA